MRNNVSTGLPGDAESLCSEPRASGIAVIMVLFTLSQGNDRPAGNPPSGYRAATRSMRAIANRCATAAIGTDAAHWVDSCIAITLHDLQSRPIRCVDQRPSRANLGWRRAIWSNVAIMTLGFRPDFESLRLITIMHRGKPVVRMSILSQLSNLGC
jgi:hypothetical protein